MAISSQFILNAYRNTEHPATGKSPAELLFGRKINDGIPFVHRPVKNSNVKKQDQDYKRKYENRVNLQASLKKVKSFKVNDQVLIKRISPKKLESFYDPIPYIVVADEGYRVKVQHPDGSQYYRHKSHVKGFRSEKREDVAE